jgi:toxin ParE1/3/4
MTVYELTRAAKNDLRSIALFTEKRWNRNQRYLYMKQFHDVFGFLAENPSAGKSCDSIKKGYRKFPQGSHVVFYRDGKNCKITIIRIHHKGMDAEAQFSDT